MTPDLFANDTHTLDPQSWNLYVYVRNNPLGWTDPTGEIVENTPDKRHKLNRDELNAIKKDLQKKTGLKSINFDKNGRLSYDKNEKASGGSAGLRAQITSAIDSQTEVFNLGDYSGSPSIDFATTDAGTKAGGVSTYEVQIDFADFRNAADLSDTHAMAAFSVGLNISHEIAHKLPTFIRDDTGDKGVISIINNFQRQLGLSTRDTNVHDITCLTGTCSIPFYNSDGKQQLLKWKSENSR
jgi:hypothetical protein